MFASEVHCVCPADVFFFFFPSVAQDEACCRGCALHSSMFFFLFFNGGLMTCKNSLHLADEYSEIER